MSEVITKWDMRYLDLAEHIAGWSKDPSRKIGAVVVMPHSGQILAQGYNGFPRGVDDSRERLDNRETKLKFVVHAELNCIYNASRVGTSLVGSTMYVHGLPICNECGKGIIQAGVVKTVMKWDYNKFSDNHAMWLDAFETTRKMFQEAKVQYDVIT
jgi:dCMP deaminase